MRDYTANENLAAIKLLAVDMDLTLLHTDKTMPAGIAEVINGLVEVGVYFCPTSGRPVSSLQTIFPKDAQIQAYIGDSGGSVVFQGEYVFKDSMDSAVWHKVAKDASFQPGAVPVLCCYDKAYMLKRDEGQAAEARKYYDPVLFIDDYADCDAKTNKFSVLYPAFDAEAAFAAYWGPMYGDVLYVSNAGREWVDITNQGINKGLGIKKLIQHLGLSMDEVAAVGDTYNDIPMLEAVGQSFVVANAEAHMHEHATWLVPSNDEEGVLALGRAIINAHKESGAA